MKTVVRILAGLVGAVVLVFVLLAAYLFLFFDVNDYRDRLAEQVRTHTGRELVISGEIGVSVFPWLGVEIGATSLGNAPGFGDEPFASVREAQARAQLMPLLRGEVEVDRVVLKGLVLNLERDAQGRNNWDDLVREPGEPHEARHDGPGDVGAAGRGIAALAIGGLDVEGAQLVWHDRKAGVRQQVSRLDITSGRIVPGAAFPLEIGFDIDSSAPAVQGRVELSASLLADPERGRYAADGLDLRFNGRGAALPGNAADLRLRAKLDVDMAAGKLSLAGLTLSGWGLEAKGELAGQGLPDAPSVEGRLELAQFSPRALLTALGQEVPQTTDPAALTRASLRTQLQASDKRVMLQGLELKLDDSTVRGTAGLTDLVRQAIAVDLQLDAINLDRYLPPGKSTPAATPGAAAAAIDLSALQGLNLDAKLVVGELVASGMKISNLTVTARAADGVLRLQPLGAELYQGRYAGNATVDARGRAPRITLDESLTGVQIGPLLRDLTGKEAMLTGRAQLRAKLQASGADTDAMKRSLSGNADFMFADGAVKGVNVAQFLREASARLRNQPVPPQSGPNQTDFSELSGTLQIANGVIRNDDLAAKSPLLRVSGSGSADLTSERIDYRARAALVGTLEGQGGAERDALRGVTVPVRIGGTFAQPTYALDVETLIAENVKQQVRDRVEQRIIEQLGGRQQAAPQPGSEPAPAESPQEQLRRGLRGLLR